MIHPKSQPHPLARRSGSAAGNSPPSNPERCEQLAIRNAMTKEADRQHQFDATHATTKLNALISARRCDRPVLEERESPCRSSQIEPIAPPAECASARRRSRRERALRRQIDDDPAHLATPKFARLRARRRPVHSCSMDRWATKMPLAWSEVVRQRVALENQLKFSGHKTRPGRKRRRIIRFVLRVLQ